MVHHDLYAHSLENRLELIVDALTVIVNSCIFSIVIMLIGNVYHNINKRKEELNNNIKTYEKFFV